MTSSSLNIEHNYCEYIITSYLVLSSVVVEAEPSASASGNQKGSDSASLETSYVHLIEDLDQEAQGGGYPVLMGPLLLQKALGV